MTVCLLCTHTTSFIQASPSPPPHTHEVQRPRQSQLITPAATEKWARRHCTAVAARLTAEYY